MVSQRRIRRKKEHTGHHEGENVYSGSGHVHHDRVHRNSSLSVDIILKLRFSGTDCDFPRFFDFQVILLITVYSLLLYLFLLFSVEFTKHNFLHLSMNNHISRGIRYRRCRFWWSVLAQHQMRICFGGISR